MKTWLWTLPRQAGDKPQETSVAVNPLDPRNAVVSFHQAVGEGSDHHPGVRVEVRVASTTDGGQTWTVADASHPAYPISIDAYVAYDLNGTAYVVNMGMGAISNETPHGEYLRRSTDCGRTWGDLVTLIERPGDEPLLEHMPKLAADLNPDSPRAGNLYAVWDRILHDRSEGMVIAATTDGGESWSAPKVIGSYTGTTLPSIAVAPDGAVHLFLAVGSGDWRSPDWKLIAQVSRDGGETFEPPVYVADTHHVMLSVPGFPRACWLPGIGACPDGTLIASWGNDPHGDLDIFAANSADGGRTWSDPVRVNDDPVGDGKDQAVHDLTVDPTDGSAYLLFYDRRDDPENRLAAMTLARSTDGGRTWTNHAWSDGASDPTAAAFGDYIGVSAYGGHVYGGWPEHLADEEQPEASIVHDYGEGVVLEEGQWPAGPAAIRVGVADFN
jgi:hypothetical protein